MALRWSKVRLTIGILISSLNVVAKRARNPLPRLGALELAVLEHMWNAGETDVVAAHRAVGQQRRISVNTALERLHRKRLATRVKVSHAYQYTPTLSRDEFRVRRVAEAAGGMRALASDGVLAAFVGLVADTNSEALDRLEELIAERRAEDER